jgi:hypothetical protein
MAGREARLSLSTYRMLRRKTRLYNGNTKRSPRLVSKTVIEKANKLGAQDWEMVGVVRVSVSPGWRAFFKRAMKD